MISTTTEERVWISKLLSQSITKHKESEEQIREQAAFLDKACDVFTVLDLEYRIVYWNKCAERLYGWKPEEAIGRNVNELLYKDKSSGPIGAKKSIIEKGEWSGELHQVTKVGGDIIVESRWILMRDNGEKPISILVVNTDITEKKKLESRLIRAQRMESIGMLAGGIVHDLNNVLAPVMLSIQMLKEKFTDEQSQKLLTILERNSQRGASLIKRVMSFVQEVGGERKPFKITYIISEIEKIAKETFPRNIEIWTNVSKDLWMVSGDDIQLYQVLMNLCLNARDAMPHGGILRISAENILIDNSYAQMNLEAKVGPYIIITFSDTGTGIPPEILDRIFEPFFTTKEHGKGTGLGLSVALEIVKSHGGFIDVHSEAGEGTVFKVYLPATKAETQKEQEQRTELPAGHGELVFVVDDEVPVLEITRATLERYGYRVLTAYDGSEALRMYSQNMEDIKIVIMDIIMPNMDGLDSIRALRKINPHIKIIGSSGLTENDKLVKVAGTDIHTFLPKPYTAETLVKTVRDVLNMR